MSHAWLLGGVVKMRHEEVVLIADGLGSAHKLRRVLESLDLKVVSGPPTQLRRLLIEHPEHGLVVYEAHGDALAGVSQVEPVLAEEGGAPMLVVVEEPQLEEFRLPVRVKADFVLSGASESECSMRVRRLLRQGGETFSGDRVVIDDMSINLATYQVEVGGMPIDLTYLEYALLSFFATHPHRTYSRDDLLRRVWGLDYIGGSRTVDVHVRRLRAKLGPRLAERLQTVRGVGYLWAS